MCELKNETREYVYDHIRSYAYTKKWLASRITWRALKVNSPPPLRTLNPPAGFPPLRPLLLPLLAAAAAAVEANRRIFPSPNDRGEAERCLLRRERRTLLQL